MRAPRHPPGPPRNDLRILGIIVISREDAKRGVEATTTMLTCAQVLSEGKAVGVRLWSVREVKRKAVLATMLKVKEVLFSSEEIEEKVREMAERITEDYQAYESTTQR